MQAQDLWDEFSEKNMKCLDVQLQEVLHGI